MVAKPSDDLAKCVLTKFATSVTRSRDSRLSGSATRRTGYDRRHSSLVGTRLLHSKLGTENCEDRRAARRARISRREAIFGWESVLSCFSSLSGRPSAIAITQLDS